MGRSGQDDEGIQTFLNEFGASGMHGWLDLHYCYRACQAAGKKEACK